MWIFLNDAMLSIVDENQHSAYQRFGPGKNAKKARRLMVRARAKGDIERVFGNNVRVEATPESDYPYRARLGRQFVVDTIAERISGIDYGNFKASVKDHDRHDAYLGVWRAGLAVSRIGQRIRDTTRSLFYSNTMRD